MKISSKLKELKTSDLNCNVFDVYSYDGLSMQELLCQFFTRINECIKASNETVDLTSWLIDEGLEIEVVNKLMLMLEDGTFKNLINVNLFNTINTKIDNINTQLTHKANLDSVFTMDNMGQDVKEAMTGGSVAVVGKNTILTENIVDNQVTVKKLSNTYAFGKVGKNKFDKKSIIVGKYTNPTTGQEIDNVNYFISDYIDIKGHSKLYVTRYSSPHFVCFYDANFNFISGQRNLFEADIEEYCYVRVSTDLVELDKLMVELDEKSDKYEGYKHVITKDCLDEDVLDLIKGFNRREYCVVSKDGYGDFTTIQEAVNFIDEKGTIKIMAGVYNETVDAQNKEISLIGENKKTCILKCQTGDYYLPPLEISAGYVSNLTIKTENIGVEREDGLIPYCVHIDYNYEENKSLEFDNCDMVSEFGACIGMGTRGGFEAKFKNCSFYNVRDMASHGAFYFHDSIKADTQGKGISKVIIENCSIISKASPVAMVINSQGSDLNTNYVTFRNNTVYSESNGYTNSLVKITGAKGGNWEGSLNYFLTADSHGNNVSKLNAI